MKKSLKTRLKKLNVVISSHIFATGPALDLEEYLKGKVESLFFIGHPFSYRKKKNSFYRFYRQGKLKEKHEALNLKAPEIFFYLRDAFLTFWWVFKRDYRIDLYIGSDNLLAFLGLIMKKLGKVERVILYTIDYSPKRFNNPGLNFLYDFFDKQCLKYCDIVWNVSSRIEKARKNFKGIGGKGYAHQIVVPLGVWYDRVAKIPFSEKKRYRVIFMGHLLGKQGLQMVIRAMPEIVKRIPQAHLVVIGTGPYEKKLKEIVKEKKLQNRVVFLGYIKDHRQVEKQLVRAGLAVATYKPTPESFTYFADPGKIKNYLAAGLPVIITHVPQVAKDLVKKRCGLICKYRPFSLAENIISILENKERQAEFSRNAIEYAKDFDWNKIFKKALQASL